MEKRVEHIIDSDRKIISRIFYGEIDLQDNLNSWKELFDTCKCTEIKGVINDFTNAKLKMKIDEISVLLKFLDENLKDLPRLKLAVISLSPNIVVFPTLAQNDFPQLNIRPFSTLEGAEKWILNY